MKHNAPRHIGIMMIIAAAAAIGLAVASTRHAVQRETTGGAPVTLPAEETVMPEPSLPATDETAATEVSAETASPAAAGGLPFEPVLDVPAVPAAYRGTIVRQRTRHFPHRILALTFDDGPSPTVTPQILDTLREYNARATFFVLGQNVRKWPEIVRQAADEGHAIGHHSYSHPSKTNPEQAAKEMAQTTEAIIEATGRAPELFRPPYGITDGNLCRTAREQGFTVILWTISSADTTSIGPEIIASNVIYTPNPGDIVLMHDSGGNSKTAEALPRILKELSIAGFEFVTIPHLLGAWEEWKKQADT